VRTTELLMMVAIVTIAIFLDPFCYSLHNESGIFLGSGHFTLTYEVNQGLMYVFHRYCRNFFVLKLAADTTHIIETTQT
jgi:hypothetical protein